MAYREAAAVDAKAAPDLESTHQRSLHTFIKLIGAIPEHRLRQSPQASAETAWAVASHDVYLLQRSVLDWDIDRYSEWLRQTLINLLLVPES